MVTLLGLRSFTHSHTTHHCRSLLSLSSYPSPSATLPPLHLSHLVTSSIEPPSPPVHLLRLLLPLLYPIPSSSFLPLFVLLFPHFFSPLHHPSPYPSVHLPTIFPSLTPATRPSPFSIFPSAHQNFLSIHNKGAILSSFEPL